MTKEIKRIMIYILQLPPLLYYTILSIMGIILMIVPYTVIVYITNFINFPYMGFVFVGLSIWFTIYRIKKG